MSKVKSRSGSAGTRRTGGRVVTRYGANFTLGKPTNKPSGRELWLTALKEGNKGGTTGGRKPGTGQPQRQGVSEYWQQTLRRAEAQVDSQPVDSFTGLRRSQDIPYMSTSHYLRQMAGTEKSTPKFDPTFKPPSGTPAYKTPEEYYDEVLELKRQMQTVRNENDGLKSRARRLEEDNTKKEKQLESLLDPTKNEELRRTLADKKDSALVVQSLKQKIFRLEQQIKDKDNAYIKLQSDIKFTKVEEMKLQLEVLYNEIVRLRHASPAELAYSRMNEDTGSVNGQGKSVTKSELAKTEALSNAVKKLGEEKTRLMQENQGLRADLARVVEEQQKGEASKREYEDMNRRQLLQTIAELDRRLEEYETALPDTGGADHGSKIVLQGNMRERLDQLDKRETELLEQLEKMQQAAERLKDDRQHYKEKYEEKCREMDTLSTTSRRVIRTPPDGGPPRPEPRARARSVASSGVEARKVEAFREKHAAKVIQRGWRAHHDDEENTDFIQNALKGYQRREEFIQQKRRGSGGGRRPSRPVASSRSSARVEVDSDDDSVDSGAVEKLQATLRGHQARQRGLQGRRRSGSGAGSAGGASRANQFARKFDDSPDDNRGAPYLRNRADSIRSTSLASAGREGVHISSAVSTGGRSRGARGSQAADSDEDDIVF